MSGTRLVTKLKMLRTGQSNKAFIVVEGITDSRLYGKLINQETCEVIIADSKSNVIQCMESCNTEGMKGIIGIADADFWRLEHHKDLPKNLFLTDFHDSECMLIYSPAYDNILAEYANRTKYLKFEERKKTPVRQILLQSAAKIGYLRWYSLLHNTGLRFSDLKFEQFVNPKELDIDMKRLIEHVISHSKKDPIVDAQYLFKEVQSLINAQYNLWDICCGHDLMEILSIGLIHIFGEYNAKGLFGGNLEGSFRLAYHYDFFKTTKLCKNLLAWQKQNRYQLLIEVFD